MKKAFPIIFLAMAVPAIGQIRAACTADSMAVARAGSIAAQELGRWTCYARNEGDMPDVMSPAGFAMDFIELRQLNAADVADVFAQKQKMTTPAKIAKVAEYVGFAGLLIMGQQYVKVATTVATGVGIATYGASQASNYFGKQIPPTANALSGLLGDKDVVLQPGQSATWKVYASKMPNASHVGPRVLTGTGHSIPNTPTPAAKPAPVPHEDASLIPWRWSIFPCSSRSELCMSS